MAKNTPRDLNQLLIYEVNPYYFSEQHGFLGIIEDLDRLKALGVDVVWLMPIHPRGEKNKLGELGSPYCIMDYRAISPLHGNIEEFEQLIEETHKRGMQLMIDVVYNHTSFDSVLAAEHPEWFYHDENGDFISREWRDVIDLDYSNKALWDYQIETLVMWAKKGVDGFRCDVASMVPVDFWVKAREEVAKVNPDHIWLNESLHMRFIRRLRQNGWYAASDGETYDAFDLCYDYDIHDLYTDVHEGKRPLKDYIEGLKRQPFMYPESAIKMHFLENHDQPPTASFIRTDLKLRQWTALLYFLQGATLIYNGQEFKNVASLRRTAEPRSIDKTEDPAFTKLLLDLRRVKSLPIVKDGWFEIDGPYGDSGVIAHYKKDGKTLLGIFNLNLIRAKAPIAIPDGCYQSLLGGSIKVEGGMADLPAEPVIIEIG